MKLATIRLEEKESAAIMTGDGALPIRHICEKFKKDWPADFLGILTRGILPEIRAWFEKQGERESVHALRVPLDEVAFAPLYRRPRKIWGIGRNYRNHAADLSEKAPEGEPASFMKPDTAIIGHGDIIECRITGFHPLINPVIDLKQEQEKNRAFGS